MAGFQQSEAIDRNWPALLQGIHHTIALSRPQYSEEETMQIAGMPSWASGIPFVIVSSYMFVSQGWDWAKWGPLNMTNSENEQKPNVRMSPGAAYYCDLLVVASIVQSLRGEVPLWLPSKGRRSHITVTCAALPLLLLRPPPLATCSIRPCLFATDHEQCVLATIFCGEPKAKITHIILVSPAPLLAASRASGSKN